MAAQVPGRTERHQVAAGSDRAARCQHHVGRQFCSAALARGRQLLAFKLHFAANVSKGQLPRHVLLGSSPLSLGLLLQRLLLQRLRLLIGAPCSCDMICLGSRRGSDPDKELEARRHVLVPIMEAGVSEATASRAEASRGYDRPFPLACAISSRWWSTCMSACQTMVCGSACKHVQSNQQVKFLEQAPWIGDGLIYGIVQGWLTDCLRYSP